MDNYSNHFEFDFSEAVVIRERINNLKIGKVRAACYGEKPSVSLRESSGDDYILDFVLPLPDGCLNVDGEMSETSTNPVSNAVVKQYIDGSIPTVTLVYANTTGKTAYSSTDSLAGYDFIVCYAAPEPDKSYSCYCVPLRYLEDTHTSPMALTVSDGDIKTTFMLTRNGFYTDSYTGSAIGKIYAIYGIKL